MHEMCENWRKMVFIAFMLIKEPAHYKCATFRNTVLAGLNAGREPSSRRYDDDEIRIVKKHTRILTNFRSLLPQIKSIFNETLR